MRWQDRKGRESMAFRRRKTNLAQGGGLGETKGRCRDMIPVTRFRHWSRRRSEKTRKRMDEIFVGQIKAVTVGEGSRVTVVTQFVAGVILTMYEISSVGWRYNPCLRRF